MPKILRFLLYLFIASVIDVTIRHYYQSSVWLSSFAFANTFMLGSYARGKE